MLALKAFILIAAVIVAPGCSTTKLEAPQASYLSSSFGSLMDATDHARANEVLEGGSEKRPMAWVNPITKRRFTVTPTRTFKRGDLDCRDFEATYVGRSTTGTACRREDGVWLLR